MSSIGWTALLHAACEGKSETVHALLLLNANPDVADCAGWTPLMYASQNGHLATVNELINWGANIEATNRYSIMVDNTEM